LLWREERQSVEKIGGEVRRGGERRTDGEKEGSEREKGIDT